MSFLTLAQADKAIATLTRVGPKVDALIQKIAVTAIGYSVIHGDITIGQRLVSAMPKGTRLDSLVAYMVKYGNFDWSKDKKALIHRANPDAITDPVGLFTSVSAALWFNAKKATEPTPWTEETAFDKFLKALETHDQPELAAALAAARANFKAGIQSAPASVSALNLSADEARMVVDAVLEQRAEALYLVQELKAA